MIKIFFSKFHIIFLSLGIMATPALAQEKNKDKGHVFQDIQDRLSKAASIKDKKIRLSFMPEKKRVIEITPEEIKLSYGYVKQLENINQLIATLSHMTAHISLDYVARPPIPEEVRQQAQKSSVTDYIKSAVRPKYPDRSNPPQATGPYHKEGAGKVERPGYQNKDYNYAVNKKKIIKAEQELEADRTTLKIMKHAGYCPGDYNRMLSHFYENPQRLIGIKHFPLDADQWQRIDLLDQQSPYGSQCSPDQSKLATKNAAEFDQLKANILASLNKRK